MKKIPRFKKLTRENIEGVIQRLEQGKIKQGDHEIVRELFELRRFSESLLDEDDEYAAQALREVYREIMKVSRDKQKRENSDEESSE